MKRAIVVLVGSMLLILGIAGCGASNGSGPGSTSATSVPGY